MSTTKIVFVAFAIEDERQRDFLKGQSLSARAPYEFIDMSVKDPYDKDWKERVRTQNPAITRRARAHSARTSLTSSGQKWEIQCAKREKKSLRGIWAYSKMTGQTW